jgi:hypothetical protein
MIDRGNKFYETAREFVKKYEENVSEHIIDIIVSVMVTRDGVGPMGGSFVQSIVNNNLFDAVNRADQDCLKNLKIIVAANRYCHLKSL